MLVGSPPVQVGQEVRGELRRGPGPTCQRCYVHCLTGNRTLRWIVTKTFLLFLSKLFEPAETSQHTLLAAPRCNPSDGTHG
jgi:hypothetical protein